MASRQLNELTLFALTGLCGYWLNFLDGAHWFVVIPAIAAAMCMSIAAGWAIAIPFIAASFFVERFSVHTRIADFVVLFLIGCAILYVSWMSIGNTLPPGTGFWKKLAAFFQPQVTPIRIKRHGVSVLVILLVSLTLTDVFSPHPSLYKRSSYQTAPEFAGKRVGLALSGGGYRAALMHAGVLARLASSAYQ